MSTFERHCQESKELFGRAFEEVHLWLDEFQGTPEYRMRHRRVRHHEAGLRQVIELCGSFSSKKLSSSYFFQAHYTALWTKMNIGIYISIRQPLL
jgi:hypothetical protein